MLIVTVAALHKNTAVTDTFSINFPTNIVKMNTLKKKKNTYIISPLFTTHFIPVIL